MEITSLSYSENIGNGEKWTLEKFSIKKVNFIVGKNSTGKSRTISILNGIANIIAGKLKTTLDSGFFDVEFTDQQDKYKYSLHIEDKAVIKEELNFNGKVHISRKKSGAAKIRFSQIDTEVVMEASPYDVLISKYQDKIQQPETNKLTEWAKEFQRVDFGSDFGKNQLITSEHFNDIVSEKNEINFSPDRLQSHVIGIYIDGFKKFGAVYDKKIIEYMSILGYDLSAIDCETAKDIVAATPLYGLHITERDLGFKILHGQISQGMYRALALIIILASKELSNNTGVLLIDDIGEGLDFERSKNLVKLVIDVCNKSKFQVIMTSNDHFAMNEVSLENWIVLKRNKTVVENYTYENSKEFFDNFKFYGLNNFELFSLGLFESNTPKD